MPNLLILGQHLWARRQTLLARYACRVNRHHKTLQKVTGPRLFSTAFASPQIEMFELDDEQWRKVFQRAPYATRKRRPSSTEQLYLPHLALLIWILLRIMR